jgi:pyruvate-formate lyase-activating enzyme
MNASESFFERSVRSTDDDPGPLARACARMLASGLWHDGQHMGRRWAIGCVALEVTQRCNLDCTLCYLSENAEAVKDIPLEEVFRRIAMIRDEYGAGTDVQITGGEPTLRARDELVAIVRRCRLAGLRPSLFTNGIRASRDLLEALCEAGLIDVAFHVDMTQGRPNCGSEVALHRVREQYIERVRGLPLSVLFNTTVFDGNLHEIAQVVEFFVRFSDVVRLASFQLQADTGRGVLGRRGVGLTQQAVAARIRAGARADINFDATDAGHPGCNRYAMTFVANGRVYDAFDDPEFVREILVETSALSLDRISRRRVVATWMAWLARNPARWGKVSRWLARKGWQMHKDLLASRGRVNKLSFFIHNFMDACGLDEKRIEACAFMVATAGGPVSMCLHNAQRDRFVLKPLEVQQGAVIRFWHPLTGDRQERRPVIEPVALTRKTARGRARRAPAPCPGVSVGR